MRRPGIHVWLIMAAVILMCSSTLAFLGGIKLFSSFAHKRFEERNAYLARYLADNVELGFLIGDRRMLAGLAENLLAQEDVVRVLMVADSGERLVDISSPEEVSAPEDRRLITAPVAIKGGRDELRAGTWQEGAGPTGRRIGEVRVYYTMAGVNRIVAEIRRRFYLLSAAFASVSLGMFVLLSRYLAKPVRQLVRAAREVAGGNLSVRVVPGRLPETRELAEAFNAMLDSLVKSNLALEEASREMVRQKTMAELGRFSMMIAHEVKNPLGIIKSSLDLLKQDRGLSSEDTMVSYIEDEIERLNRLIEDFLAFARPVSPKPRLAEAELLVRECVVRFELQDLGGESTFQLDLPERPTRLLMDPDLITRVVSNVLKNALDMTGGAGVIDIMVTTGQNEWVCRIADRGPGIEPADLEKIFEPFFTGRTKGTGLGLAFAAQVLKGHHGSIKAGNRPEGGAVFTITLPITTG